MSRRGKDTMVRCRTGGPVIGSFLATRVGTVITLPSVRWRSSWRRRGLRLDRPRARRPRQPATSRRSRWPHARPAPRRSRASLARTPRRSRRCSTRASTGSWPRAWSRAAQARRLVERLHHPPRGSRGFAARRAQGYGRAARPRRPTRSASFRSSRRPVSPPPSEIAAVEGVDALVVGCADLALALDGPPREAIARRPARRRGTAGSRPGSRGPTTAELLLELAGEHSTLLVCSARTCASTPAPSTTPSRRCEPTAGGLRVGA